MRWMLSLLLVLLLAGVADAKVKNWKNILALYAAMYVTQDNLLPEPADALTVPQNDKPTPLPEAVSFGVFRDIHDIAELSRAVRPTIEAAAPMVDEMLRQRRIDLSINLPDPPALAQAPAAPVSETPIADQIARAAGAAGYSPPAITELLTDDAPAVLPRTERYETVRTGLFGLRRAAVFVPDEVPQYRQKYQFAPRQGPLRRLFSHWRR